MNIFYGTEKYSIDVTQICLDKLTKNNMITIPQGDNNRSNYFTDPLLGIHKKIFIEINETIHEYDEYNQITINMMDHTINVINDTNIINKLHNIHSKLQINYGNFNDEFPEQKMSVRYLTGNEKVLELGGNIGRNTLVIASILNHSQFVTLESDPDIAKQLIKNRDLNHFNFHVEDSALSNKKLIQKGWDTIQSDVLLENYKWINTITLDQLNAKYNIDFDTLVLDCEGAFYYILMDFPEILTHIKLIIMENDYWNITHKNYVDEVLLKNNFYVDYQEAGGWGPCYQNFFEVWKKD